MRAIWQGVISLALVSIPIKIYPAIVAQFISFRTLHAKDKAPIHYKRVCEKCGQEVAWEEVIKGFEYERKKYFPLSKEALKKLKPAKSDIIEVIGFLDKGLVHPIYFSKPYYVAPAKAKDRAYFLFREILELTGKVAFVRIVIKDKEHIAILEPYKNGLLLTTLNYSYEIKPFEEIEELKAGAPTLKKAELELAKQLVEKFSLKKLELEKYKDTFYQRLKELILKLIRGEKIVVAKPKSKKTLMEALKASIK